VQIILDDHTFVIIHKTNKRIKRVSLSLQNQDEIIIKTPLRFKAHLLKEIVFEHKRWILNAVKKVPVKNSFEFITGGMIPYLGKNYKMILIQDETIKKVKFTLKEELFYIYYHSDNQSHSEFIDGLKLFYKFNAINVIDHIFDQYTHITQLFPEKITYRFAKTRWGSCSYINNISINYMLLQFDIKAIEYVVLHELCHIKEKNHSKRFWDLVSFYMPEYKNIQKTIKNKIY